MAASASESAELAVPFGADASVRRGEVLGRGEVPAGGEILAAPIAAGPMATYVYTIPAACSLVGYDFSIQAAGFNIPNNAPWVLSNAQDRVLGF